MSLPRVPTPTIQVAPRGSRATILSTTEYVHALLREGGPPVGAKGHVGRRRRLAHDARAPRGLEGLVEETRAARLGAPRAGAISKLRGVVLRETNTR